MADPNQRFAAPVYQTASALAQYRGPSDDLRFAIVDGLGLFRWHLNDTTDHDGESVIEPSGGPVGRWKVSTPFFDADLANLLNTASDEAEADSIAVRGEDGEIAASFIEGDEYKYEVDFVITSNVSLPALPSSSLTGGSALSSTQSVALVGQTAPAQNGIYVNDGGVLARRADFDSSADVVPGSTFFVVTGGSRWRLTSPTGTISVGADALVFQQVGRSGGVVELGTVSNEVLFDGLLGRIYRLTASGSVNLTLSNLNPGETYVLHFTQDATGYHTLNIGGWTPIDVNSVASDGAPLSETVYCLVALSDSECAVYRVASDIIGPRVRGLDANTLPAALYIRGGRPSVDNHGKEPTNNVVFEAGLGAQSTNGETSQINLLHGDARIAELTPWIAAEIGFVDEYGYDPASSESLGATPPGTRTWRQRTPRKFRIHSGTNADTGVQSGILIHASKDLDFSANELVQTSVLDRGAYIAEAFANFTAVSSTSGDGQGGTARRVNRYVTTVGATTQYLYVGNDVPFSKLALCEARIIAHAAGDTRERFHFDFEWLGGTLGSGAFIDSAKIGDYTGSTSRTGRILITDEGAGTNGMVSIRVTGVAAKTINWTLFLDLFIPPVV